MQQHDIEIKKTGRYFTLGELNGKTEEIWFVLHGYGQLANYFLKRFDVLNDGTRLIVAPEGLHRFYWNGFSGRVVASWMTREDRLTDISDYVRFLDTVYTNVVKSENIKVKLVGFSQGTATACRWALLGNARFDQLILWAGAFPDDIDYFENAELFNDLNIKLVVGKNDQFYTEEKIQEHKKALEDKGIKFELREFDGDHNVYPEPLMDLV